MARTRWRASSPIAGLLVLLIVAIGFFVQRQITSSAFDHLESDQVAQDAQRLRIALDYEVRLLSNYGATNSIWDNSFADVANADEDAFAADFPPGDIHRIYGVDGVAGTRRDGTFRVGGLVGGSSGYQALPSDLSDPGVLAKLFDPAAAAGTGRCGVVRSSAAPYLYCGFASYRGDSSGPPSGGLIYFKALNDTNLGALGAKISMPVRLVDASRATNRDPLSLPSTLGVIKVNTSTVGADHIALDVSIPTTTGSPIVIEGLRDRPIHRTAATTMLEMFIFMCVAAAVLLIAMMLLVRRGVKRSVGPLRRTAEAVITSGDRSLRVRSAQRGEIGALGNAIDTMLDALAEQDADLESANVAREEHLRTMYAQRRLAEQQARRRAQGMISDTVANVVSELRAVVEQTEAVRSAADTIDARVGTTEDVARDVVSRSHHADQVAEELTQSLRRVEGIANLISDVARQTNLLALNATIEAVRAGEAGRSFSVVANEVKELASTTARSTAEITATVRALEQGASAMAGVIDDMRSGVASVDEAATAVTAVTREQHATVERLNESVEAAIGRIQTMSRLTDQLERRASPRVPAGGLAALRFAGQEEPAQMLDLSELGMRCMIDSTVPLATGDHVEAIIPFEDGSRTALRAEIVHRQDDEAEAEVGMRFIDTPPDVATRLHRIVVAALEEPDASAG